MNGTRAAPRVKEHNTRTQSRHADVSYPIKPRRINGDLGRT